MWNQRAAADLLTLLKVLGRHVHAVLLPCAKQLGLEAVNLLVQLLDVSCLADLLIHLQCAAQAVYILRSSDTHVPLSLACSSTSGAAESTLDAPRA